MKVVYFIYVITFICIAYFIYYANLIRIDPNIENKYPNFENKFDVYVINLKSNPERLENFLIEYKNSDISFKELNIYPAVVGKTLDVKKYITHDAYLRLKYIEKTKKRVHHYDITRGGVGCYLSHLDIYRRIVDSNKEYGLIFEDDVIIDKLVYKKMLYGLNTLPNDWDMYMLGIMCLNCNTISNYSKVNRFWGMHGYLIKKSTAVKLLGHLNKLIDKQIDADISLLIKNNNIVLYANNPSIVSQHMLTYESTIQINSFEETYDLFKEEFTNDDFDIYVINLVSNKERLNNFTYEYNKSDLSFKTFNVYPAIVGKELDLTKYVTIDAHQQILLTEKTGKRIHHYDLTRGAVGCYLSHLNIYKKIAESNKKYGLIFEDDVKIASDFYKRMLYGLNTVPNDWDIYLLGVVCLKCNVNQEYINIDRFWGMHGYLIKKETAAKLVKKLDVLIKKQIDADLSLLIKNNELKVYGINPLIVIQDGTKFESDIQTPVENNIDAFNEEFNQQQLEIFYNNYKN